MKSTVPSDRRALLALIPARGGSKGLPRKNILVAGGLPLVAWTIAAAREAATVDQVVLSSDHDEIMATAMKYGCDAVIRRPDELASDTATSIDVVLHALTQLPDFEYVALLQPTSPLRTGRDIDAAFRLMQKTGAPSCVSVCPTRESPYWMYQLNAAGELAKLLSSLPEVSRRQDLPETYVLNGAIYIADSQWLRKNGSFISERTVAYTMPAERSVDIDNADDFEAFRRLVE